MLPWIDKPGLLVLDILIKPTCDPQEPEVHTEHQLKLILFYLKNGSGPFNLATVRLETVVGFETYAYGNRIHFPQILLSSRWGQNDCSSVWYSAVLTPLLQFPSLNAPISLFFYLFPSSLNSSGTLTPLSLSLLPLSVWLCVSAFFCYNYWNSIAACYNLIYFWMSQRIWAFVAVVVMGSCLNDQRCGFWVLVRWSSTCPSGLRVLVYWPFWELRGFFPGWFWFLQLLG